MKRTTESLCENCPCDLYIRRRRYWRLSTSPIVLVVSMAVLLLLSFLSLRRSLVFSSVCFVLFCAFPFLSRFWDNMIDRITPKNCFDYTDDQFEEMCKTQLLNPLCNGCSQGKKCSEYINFTCKPGSDASFMRKRKKAKILTICSLIIVVCALTFVLGRYVFSHEESGAGTRCYVTLTGEKYHSGSCQYLSFSKISTTVYAAKRGGYKPCSRCSVGAGKLGLATEYGWGFLVSFAVCGLLYLPVIDFIERKVRSSKSPPS